MQSLLRAAVSILRRTRAESALASQVQASVHAILESALQLHRSGRLDDALPLYRRAIELDPASDVAHNLLGAFLCGQGRLTEGEACFRKALETNPSNVEALNNLGNVCKDKGDVSGAQALYRQALERSPGFASAHINLGLLHFASGRLDDAVQCFQRALGADRHNAEAHNNLGTALRMQGNPAEAESHFRAAVAADPGLAEAYCGLGDVLQLRGLPDEAEVCCRKALELRPSFPEAMQNLATIAISRGNLDAAKAYCNDALRIDPAHIGALNNLGNVAARRADHRGAEALYRRALAVDPNRAVTRFNLSNAVLLRGDYAEGFELYESRFDALQRPYARLSSLNGKLRALPRWRGEPLGEKRLLVWAEQGLGDSLMMLRYLPLLRERGVASFAVCCDAALDRIVRSMGTGAEVVTAEEAAEAIDFDVHCPMLSLPWAFGTRHDSIPGSARYLDVPQDIALEWRARLNGDRPLVGLAWAGSRTLRDDARRSISLDKFSPLLAVEGVGLISLQKGDAAKQWSGSRRDGDRHIDLCNDFLDTAALISNLDLVLSVDTAVAHLAGALGKPVWLLNRHESEWRWGLEADNTPWYSSMKIIREPHFDGWDVAIARVTAELKAVDRLDGDR